MEQNNNNALPQKNDSPGPFDGAPIFSYTRKQAIEDGVLADVTEMIKGRSPFKFPVALTAAVHVTIESAIANQKFGNDYIGVLSDILLTAAIAGKNTSGDTCFFQTFISGLGKKKVHSFKMVIGPGDDTSPGITIMLPNED
jgi:hypothetical protein